jgi:hypothetical protein
VPLSNPIISRVAPVKVGGAANAGVGRLASASDHVHPLTETSGPTDLALGNLFTDDLMSRSAGALIGRTVRSNGTTNSQNTTLATPTDVLGTDFVLPKAGTYFFLMVSAHNTAAATTALQLSYSYSGTVAAARIQMAIQVSATTFETATTSVEATLIQAPSGSGYAVAGQSGLVLVWGRVSVSSAGTFRLRFASEVAGSQVSLGSALTTFMVEA